MSDGGTVTDAASDRLVDEQVQTDVTGPIILQVDPNRNNVQLVNVNGPIIRDEVYALACDYINYRLRKAGFSWPDCPALPAEPSRYCLVMRTLGDEFERRYAEVFHDMSTTLQITPNTASSTFLSVCGELFRGNGDQIEIKWGRIVALYAFAGALAVQCVDKEMPQQVSNIAEWVTFYTQTHLSDWIASHGGWNGFVQFYENKNTDEKWPSFRKVMTGVGIACGAVGVATLAGMLVGRP